MKSISTLATLKGRVLGLFLILFVFLLGATSYAQTKSYATVAAVVTDNGNVLTASGVKDVAKAQTASLAEFAVMTTDVALGIGAVKIGGNAGMQLKFPSNRAAGATTYVRVDKPVQTGLSLDLGGLLGLFGTSINAELYSGATAGSNGTKISTAVETKVVIDADGNYYIAVIPVAGTVYNSVRINLTYPSNLLTLVGSIKLNVYHAFTFDNSSSGLAPFSDFGTSTGLNLLPLTDMVQNPQDALVTDDTKFSTISLGTLAVAGKCFPNFLFQWEIATG